MSARPTSSTQQLSAYPFGDRETGDVRETERREDGGMDVVLVSLCNAFSSPLAIIALNQSCVPPGFQVNPTEEELLNYYLRKKVGNEKIDLDVIRNVDLNMLEPWDIQERDQEIATTDKRKNKEKVKEEDRKGEAFRREGGEHDKEFMQKIIVRAVDMALALQRRAFRCAREVFDKMPKLENKQVQSKNGVVRQFWKKMD